MSYKEVVMPSFYEFFAGGGMARLGLGEEWLCQFANDISPIKAASYRDNFEDDGDTFASCDINDLKVSQIPGRADLLWASFPCQDLSLAGAGKGLNGSRSGLIWKLLDIAKKLKRRGRGPKAIVLENVTGLLNSRNGEDFYDILASLRAEGFVFGTLMMDAVHFLPHSRPRIFLVAVDIGQVAVSPRLLNGRIVDAYPWTTPRLDTLWRNSPTELRDSWIWWNVPNPPPRSKMLADLIDSTGTVWDGPEYTANLLRLMVPLHLQKVEKARLLGREIVGTLYRRTRVVNGIRAQRVEVRFDGISGCLRTPTGGSSRQRLLMVKNGSVRSRLLSAREAARLMGIPDCYRLPQSYNDAYQLAGDGVAVPVVNWLSEKLLLPMLAAKPESQPATDFEMIYA